MEGVGPAHSKHSHDQVQKSNAGFMWALQRGIVREEGRWRCDCKYAAEIARIEFLLALEAKVVRALLGVVLGEKRLV